MATLALESVGLCAHDSMQGDWAFDYAFALARVREVQLNIFHFLADPYDDHCPDPGRLSRDERNAQVIQQEKELRFRYDDRLADHMKVGFRVCERNEWTELHHCLMRREFDLLVLACPEEGARFGRRSITEFVHHFASPAVMIGPDRTNQVLMNQPAMFMDKVLGFSDMADERYTSALSVGESTGFSAT